MNHTLFGNTGLSVPVIGIGALPMGPSQRDYPVEKAKDVLLYALEQGIDLLDTAQYYDTDRFLRAALDSWRDKGGKLPLLSSRSLCGDYDGMRKAVEDTLSDLNLSCIDIFMLHEVWGLEDFAARQGAWEALKDCKAEGLVKCIGVSTHHVDVTAAMAYEEDCDCVFSLLNMASLGIRKGDGPGTKEEMAEALKACHDAGKGVFTMKAFGGGNLTADYVACLDYVTGLDCVDCVMLGLSSREEVDAAVSYADGTLPKDYVPDTSEKRMYIEQSDCEGCGSCKARCRSQAIFWNKNGLAEIDQTKCVRCGYCAPVCPVRAIIYY